ncbi:MAG: hypothetical protein ACNI3C_02145 [Candidatus Marinarcus sp.]|uniref:hypothetical protein n=1 Tax=Candidatus Marinarcus sp. TaxID=3100987 RepID=UPI003B006098
MFKLNHSNIFYKFLLFMPFVAIISNKLSPIIAYAIIGCFLLSFLFFKIQFNQLKIGLLLYLFFLTIILYISFIYQQLQYDFNNLYYIQFFGSQLLLLFIFTLFININYVNNIYLKSFFKTLIYIVFFSVILDYILLQNGMFESQMMFKAAASSYHGKPLGIFGQFSINSSYIVIFYMLYLSFENKLNKTLCMFLFSLVTVTVLLEDSGTGYIVYCLLIITIFYKFKIVRYIFLPMGVIIVYFIIQSNLVTKISYTYLNFLYQYFNEILNVNYVSHIHTISDILFGIDGNYNFPIDFGPLFLIAKVGFLYFIFYSIAIFYMIHKAPDRYFKMAIISLVLGNIHYPTLFYPIMNVLLPLLFIYVINFKKGILNNEYINKM